MIAFLLAPFATRVVEKFAYAVASLVVAALLFGGPLLGYMSQPWWPWWMSGHTTVGVGGPPAAAVPAPVPVAVATPVLAAPVPTLAPLPQSSVVEGVIALAMTWRGTPYLWGGCSRRGIDCSCAVQTWWAAFGIHMPRVTTDQVRWATPVSRDQIQPGDLVFFNNTCTECGANPTHVGMAIGGGQMINAGDPVQIASYISGFYGAHYASAGRVH